MVNLVIVVSILGAEQHFLLTSGLVLNSLYHKLVSGYQFRDHLLKANDRVIRMCDRCSIEVWLVSVGRWWNMTVYILTLHIAIIVSLHFISHAVLAELRQDRHWYEVRVVP